MPLGSNGEQAFGGDQVMSNDLGNDPVCHAMVRLNPETPQADVQQHPSPVGTLCLTAGDTLLSVWAAGA